MAAYVSEQRARLAELEGRKDRLTVSDAQWLLEHLKTADQRIEELRDRIDDAGSLMNTRYVADAIDYVRWSRTDPRGPVLANGRDVRDDRS